MLKWQLHSTLNGWRDIFSQLKSDSNRKFPSHELDLVEKLASALRRDLLHSLCLFILLNSKLIVACAHETNLFDCH